jgi:hypothetical protein
MLYQTAADQSWLRLWVSLYGADSKLARYLDPPITERRLDDRLPPANVRPRSVDVQARRKETRQPRPANVETTAAFAVPPGENIAPLDRRSLRRLLEDAPQYFAAINTLRTTSPDDYELFRQIGCIIPANEDTSRYRISIDPKDALPAFAAGIWLGKHWGGKCWEGHEDERNKYARIAIFKRVIMATGAYVPFGDVIYEWIDIWANHAKGTGGGDAAYLGVDRASGRVRVLAQPTVSNQRLPSGETISHARVGLPNWVRLMYRDWLADLDAEASHLKSETIHQWAGSLLGIALAETRAVDAGWQVHLSQDKAVMRLCVPERSAKVFFADREAEEGQRRRAIFHIVSEHVRVIGGNRITTVREHYRGNRQFNWSGYRVLITVPGHHHGKLSEFAIDSYDEAIVPKNRYTIDLPSAARKIAAYLWRSSKLHSYRRGW